MTISSSALAPFGSYLLAKSDEPINDCDEALKSIIKLAFFVIEATITSEKRVGANTKSTGRIIRTNDIPVWNTCCGAHVIAKLYVEKRPVGWLDANAKEFDQLTNLICLSLTPDGRLLTLVTDSDHRATLSQAFFSGLFDPWIPVNHEILISAFVEKQTLKTLWLAGSHRTTPIKPNSKIISGLDIGHAIDPLGDTTYLAGAVRSASIGVSLRNASVWTKANSDLDDLNQQIDELLLNWEQAIVTSSTKNSLVHPVLAKPILELDDLHNCYYVEHTDVNTLRSSHARRTAQNLIDRFEIELNSSFIAFFGISPNAFSIKIFEIKSKALAILTVIPKIKNGRISFDLRSNASHVFHDWIKGIERFPFLLRVFYESGHSISDSAISCSRIKDREFNSFKFCSFINYSVKDEKPPACPPAKTSNVKDMMTIADQSLFKWIYKEGISILGLQPLSPSQTWLYCDDGSSEVADFVHLSIVSGEKTLTLFHAKGANSNLLNRKIAPGPYELVCAQAIKNLRAFDNEELIDRIRKRLQNSNGSRLVWDQPWAPNLPNVNHSTFENALNNLGTDYSCHLCIVQPHLIESIYEPVPGKPSKSVGARQLRALLASVQSLAQSVTAKFTVISSK